MLQITCAEVNELMPPSLAKRMEALMVERYGEYLPVTCAWIGSGNSREDVLDAATEHVKAEHAVRSWPPEFWISMRECIHEA